MKIETITNSNINCVLNGLEISSYNFTLERIKPVQPTIIDSTIKELALRHAAYLLYKSLNKKFIDDNNSFCNDILYFNNFNGIKDNKNNITIDGIFFHQNRFIIIATVNDTETEIYYCMW